MNKITIILLVLAVLGSDALAGDINVINTTPPDGTLVRQGRSVRLSCRSDARWFFCVWKSPGGDKQCAINQIRPTSVCTGDDRIKLAGGVNSCDLEIDDVRPEDFGAWTCLLTEPDNFESDREDILLEVGRPARVAFDPGFGTKNELTVTEGENVMITCSAKGGHPAAQVSWESPVSTRLDVIKAKPIFNHDIDNHVTDVTHTAEYKADLKDDGKEITCLSTQIDKDGRTVLYESSTSLKLKVEKIVLPVDDALTQRIGIISGVLLAIIFLILLLVFCAFVVCKRRRRQKRSRPSSSQEVTESSPEPPIKPIWTTHPLLAPGGGPAEGGKPSPDMAQHGRRLADFSAILEPNGRQNGSNGKPRSQGTMSTRSTTSNTSWGEDDRSVGGEVEEAAPPRHPKQSSPSLHETHFGSDLDLPRTVLHHPDPYLQQQRQQQHPLQHASSPYYGNGPPQHHSNGGHPSGRQSLPQTSQPPLVTFGMARPASSAAEHHPMLSLWPSSTGRPASALSFPNEPPYGLMGGFGLAAPGGRPLPPPGCQLTMSAKSVFDCDQGCFVDMDTGETVHSHPSSSEQSNDSSEVASRRTSVTKDV